MKVTINYCDKCKKESVCLEEVELCTPKEYIKRELCVRCASIYKEKLIELGEWLKNREL